MLQTLLCTACILDWTGTSACKSARLMKQKVDVYVWFKSDLFSICAWDRSKSITVLYCLFIIVQYVSLSIYTVLLYLSFRLAIIVYIFDQ